MIISPLEHILKVFLWGVWMGISHFPTDPKLSTLTSPQACRAERAPTICLENPHIRRSLCGKSLQQDQKRGRKSKKTHQATTFRFTVIYYWLMLKPFIWTGMIWTRSPCSIQLRFNIVYVCLCHVDVENCQFIGDYLLYRKKHNVCLHEGKSYTTNLCSFTVDAYF